VTSAGQATSKRAQACSVGIGLSLLGGVGVVIGSALPWIGIGGVNRSAFTLARVANEMKVFERRSQRFAVYTLLMTPVLVPLGLFLVSVGWRRSSAFALFIVGVIGLASGGVGVWASIGEGPGPMVTATGGAFAFIGSCLVAFFAGAPTPAFQTAHA
jgi:hypothetical protein